MYQILEHIRIAQTDLCQCGVPVGAAKVEGAPVDHRTEHLPCTWIVVSIEGEMDSL